MRKRSPIVSASSDSTSRVNRVQNRLLVRSFIVESCVMRSSLSRSRLCHAIYLRVAILIHILKLRQVGHDMLAVVPRVSLVRDLLGVENPVAGGVTRVKEVSHRGHRGQAIESGKKGRR